MQSRPSHCLWSLQNPHALTPHPNRERNATQKCKVSNKLNTIAKENKQNNYNCNDSIQFLTLALLDRKFLQIMVMIMAILAGGTFALAANVHALISFISFHATDGCIMGFIEGAGTAYNG